jgi:hypothetical protein
MAKPPVPELLSFAWIVGSCRFAPVAMTRKEPIDIRPITASDLELRREAFLKARVITECMGVCVGLAEAISSECISDRTAVSIRAPQRKNTAAAAVPFTSAKAIRKTTAAVNDAPEM